MTTGFDDYEPLVGINLSGLNLQEANLSDTDLRRANLKGSNLNGACLIGADLIEADLTRASLRKADLGWARLVRTSVEEAIFSEAHIYGTSVWDLKGEPLEQHDLVMTPGVGHQLPSIKYARSFEKITVDSLEVAQFMYLLLNNKSFRSVIDTITSKIVLILGRFNEQQFPVLDGIRTELRRLGLAPVLFDFENAKNKDVTGTVELIARMAQFVIADLTDPSSLPHELATTVPFLRTTPVVTLRKRGAGGYSMFSDFERAYPWVLPVHEYSDPGSLLNNIPTIIMGAQGRLQQLRANLPTGR